jgi:hypothetical protein
MDSLASRLILSENLPADLSDLVSVIPIISFSSCVTNTRKRIAYLY